ncbi:MAG: Serine/threonine protein kinase PrkC, regulator of stationary phase [Labilithrix sp.]|nr:Serine/threonine protein kinase PrkC, regulator of stationary phase [Labilithrix sp.]
MTQGEEQAVDPLVGTVVANKYRIVKQLGEGGMGCVYLAEQQLGTSVRKVALKTLHKHLSHDPAIKKRFDREAGTVAALEHPNTIQVYDFGEMEDGTLYLVMEFVQGRSVADILEKDGPMPPARVENILRQVSGSLEEAHSHGIVHRDLKPDNVVLCERAGQKDWVEVLDFGIAKRSSEHDPNEAKLTQQGMVLGTPPYMSPEQFTGQPVDVRSDIYALGVMTYEMLVGKYPFEANTAWEWASKHMTEAPRPIETQALGQHVPERMRHAITRALAKNKDERFSSVKEFFEALSGGGMPNQTAVMNQSHGHDANGGAAAAAANRPKTEMGAPVMDAGPYGGGGPPAGATPPYGGAGMGPGMGTAGPSPSGPGSAGGAVVPAGPTHTPAKGGGNGLVIGLGALAVLLIGGGVLAFALRGKPKPPPGDPLADLSGTPSATVAPVESATTATTDDADAGVTGATPLGGPVVTTAVGVKPGTGTGTKPTAPAKPVPTPVPKADPPICVVARNAAKSNRPTAAQLAAQCKAAGGTL